MALGELANLRSGYLISRAGEYISKKSDVIFQEQWAYSIDGFILEK